MPSTPPEGDHAPPDGSLPASAGEGAGARAFGVYVHVPFCAVRCGYCDFNTYTASELGGGASQATFARTAVSELALARRVLGEQAPPAATVFVGGGTPTLLSPDDLGLLLDGVRSAFGPDHVSAYALVVEQGTKLATRVRRGEVTMPDDDDEADKYELADETLGAAGLSWYEVSNWSTSTATRCRHNVGYWQGADWWG